MPKFMEFGKEDKNSAFSKKAFEISYALIRLAESLGKDQFAGYLKSLGLDLLHGITNERYEESIKSLRSTEYFCRLAGSIGSVTSRNAEMIADEANTLGSAVMVHLESLKTPHIQLESIFSQEPPSVLYTHTEEIPEDFPLGEINQDEFIGIIENDPLDNPADSLGASSELPNHHKAEYTENRQEAVLKKIRQSGNCRMKDIQVLFPEVSERTLRYDLQSLIEKNLVERIGQSGPATYYRAREVGTA